MGDVLLRAAGLPAQRRCAPVPRRMSAAPDSNAVAISETAASKLSEVELQDTRLPGDGKALDLGGGKIGNDRAWGTIDALWRPGGA